MSRQYLALSSWNVVEHAWLFVIAPLAAAWVVWWLVGRRDRAALKRRYPGARGRWVCGWIGVLPYGITCLIGMATSCDLTCAQVIHAVGHAGAASPGAASTASSPTPAERYRELVVTAAAGKQLRDMARRDKRDCIRIAVIADHAGRLQVRMTPTDETDPQRDHLTRTRGVWLVMDRDSAVRLSGATLDYREGTDESGFIWTPPEPETGS